MVVMLTKKLALKTFSKFCTLECTCDVHIYVAYVLYVRLCEGSTYQLDCSLDEVFLVREVKVGIVRVNLLAHSLHRDLLQIGAHQDLLHALHYIIVL